MKMKSRRKKAQDPFEDEFIKIHEEMERMVNDILTLHYRNEQLARKHSPFVYGFSMKVTSQGKPEIKEFGTALPPQNEWNKKAEFEISREPLIDIIEGKEDVSVIAELPGARREDIHITATEDSMTLSSRYHDKQYQKQIMFPCKVNSDSGRATYNNGVLEIKYRRTHPKQEHGKEVKIN
ncbi:MAG TPA: archaeal heat shock protein Hsp20 [Candidatus Norongarragalinales archaeon]|nr:archaeal heat shock protein Hsp20 [Candidatus Norongarragalinales archaeon]